MSPGPKQFKRQKRKTHQNMIPILPSSPFFSPLLCLKSSFSAFQPHLSNFTPSLFKFGRGGGKWVISLCLVKELTHKKSRSVWESNPKSAKNLPLWSRRLFYTFRRGGKEQQHFPCDRNLPDEFSVAALRSHAAQFNYPVGANDLFSAPRAKSRTSN